MEGMIDKIWERSMTTGLGRIKLLELTEKGQYLLKASETNLNRSKRKGGPEHERWKKKLADEYREKGWKVIEEYPIGGGKSVDLACFKDGRKIAIEIETGNSYAAYKVKKCLKAGFDEVKSVKT